MKGWLHKLHKHLDNSLASNAEVKILQYFSKIKISADPHSCKRRKLVYQIEFSNELELIESLVNRGYLSNRDLNGSIITAITSEGEKRLEKCYQDKSLGILSKFTILFKKDYWAMLSVIATLISIISMFAAVSSCEGGSNKVSLNSSHHENY